MISLLCSLVIDRLSMACIGTRWIQYRAGRWGATKHISSWKIEVNGKCEKESKRGTTSCARNTVVSCYQRIVDTLLASDRIKAMYGLYLKIAFSTLVVRKTRSGQRRLHFLRQTTRAGLENPRSLCYGGWVWQVVIRFSFCLSRAPFPASSFGRYRHFT